MGFAAKPAANLGRGYTKLRHFHPEKISAVLTIDKMPLRTNPKFCSAICVDTRHTGVRFNIALVSCLGDKAVFDDQCKYGIFSFLGTKMAQYLLHTSGFPTINDLKKMITMNSICDNPVTVLDVELAEKIFGPDVKELMERHWSMTSKGGASAFYSPRNILKLPRGSYEDEFKVSRGSYVQAHDGHHPKNHNSPRTLDCI